MRKQWVETIRDEAGRDTNMKNFNWMLYYNKVREINKIVRNDGNDCLTVHIAHGLATGHASEMDHVWLCESILENAEVLYSHEEACRLYKVYKSVLDKVKEDM